MYHELRKRGTSQKSGRNVSARRDGSRAAPAIENRSNGFAADGEVGASGTLPPRGPTSSRAARSSLPLKGGGIGWGSQCARSASCGITNVDLAVPNQGRPHQSLLQPADREFAVADA